MNLIWTRETGVCFILVFYDARIAQLAEQDTLNVKVPGSIPGAGTIISVVFEVDFKVNAGNRSERAPSG